MREAAKIQARIGYMAQDFTLERLSVNENLAFAAGVRAVTGDIYRQSRAALLTMAGLMPFTGRRERGLSGGMRKKLALCTNLIHRPPLLLLDEPGPGCGLAVAARAVADAGQSARPGALPWCSPPLHGRGRVLRPGGLPRHAARAADRQRHPGRYWAQADLVASAGVEEIFRAHLGRA